MKSFFSGTQTTPFVIEQDKVTANTIVYLPTKNSKIGYCFATKCFLPDGITPEEKKHFLENFQQVFHSSVDEYGEYLESKEFMVELHQEQMEELLSFSCKR